MITKKNLLEIVNQKINPSYFRALSVFKGKNIKIIPSGYHEATDENGNLIYFTGDVIARSKIPEIAASKTIGGAILGLWSMKRHHGLSIPTAFLYEINQIPQKDLSHLDSDDFMWLQEVRYSNPVRAKYIGKFPYTNDFNNGAENFYNRLTADPWDNETFTDEDIEKWDEFEKLILTLNKSNLT